MVPHAGPRHHAVIHPLFLISAVLALAEPWKLMLQQRHRFHNSDVPASLDVASDTPWSPDRRPLLAPPPQAPAILHSLLFLIVAETSPTVAELLQHFWFLTSCGDTTGPQPNWRLGAR